MTSFKKKIESFECIICLTDFNTDNHHHHGTRKCNHEVCGTCIRRYFNNILKNAITYKKGYDLIQCPSTNCKQHFQTTNQLLREFFTQDETEAWWNLALATQAYIKNKVTCPVKECGAIFDVDEVFTKECTFAECQECHKGFCLACQNPWHPGKTNVVNDEEAAKMTLKHAENSQWSRCPSCFYIVEKQGGCEKMHCRCGETFCYKCGRRGCVCSSVLNGRKQQLNESRSQMFAYKKQ